MKQKIELKIPQCFSKALLEKYKSDFYTELIICINAI